MDSSGAGLAAPLHLDLSMDDWPIWFRLTVAVLATWRIVQLVAREDGPLDIVVRIRAHAGHGRLGQLMDCPYCLSLWIAMPFAFLIAEDAVTWLSGWLAISGGASLFERFAERRGELEPVQHPPEGDT